MTNIHKYHQKISSVRNGKAPYYFSIDDMVIVSVLEVGTLKWLLLTPSFVSFMARLQLDTVDTQSLKRRHGMNRVF